MSDLLAARLQMAFSLSFHIVFAAIGMAMPFLMAVSHALWLRSKDETYLRLTKAWSKGLAIFFATGAVSGTVLSFELGLLWPQFMREAGAVIGLPFALEGAAFFIEAIALGIFLYGWDRVPPWVHWSNGLIVGISGVASGFFVISANGWMNTPRGFDWVNGHAVNIRPWEAMANPAAFMEGLHMTVAAFAAVGFAVAGVHAWRLLVHPKNKFHQKAFIIALAFGATAALIQPLVGDLLTKNVAQYQPIKLAAMEARFSTMAGAPIYLGGIPSEEKQSVRFALPLPKLLSFLAYGDINAEVKGLNDFPRDQWPPVAITHLAFQFMVGIGFVMAAFGALFWFFFFAKRQNLVSQTFLRAAAVATPLGFLAIEAGWIVTEVGRQPWIIYQVMRTKEALTPMPGLVYPFLITCFIYLFLALMVLWLLWRQILSVERATR